MDDFSSFLTHFKDSPGITVVVFVFCGIKAAELFAKYVLPLFRKKKSVEQILAGDAAERRARQAEVDGKFVELETGLKEVRTAIEENDALTGKTSEGTLVGLLFNDSVWPFLRMKSFRRLLAKKKNGRIWEKGFSLISGSKEYQKAWLDVQEIELDVEIEDEEYYRGRLREIENRITHDFSLRTA